MATFGLGFSVGSGVGGFVASGGVMWHSLSVIVACSIIQLMCAAMLVPRAATNGATGRAPQGDDQGDNWRAALTTALASRDVRILLLLQVCASASFHLYDATSQLFLRNALGYSSAQRGYLLAFAGWAFAAQTYLVVPRLVRSFRAMRLLQVAFLLIGIGRSGLAAATRLPRTATIVVSYCGLNLGQGLIHTLLKGLMRDTAEGKRLGLMLGVLGSVERSIGVVAPLAAGPAYDGIGAVAPALLASFSGLCGCVLSFAFAFTSPSGKTKAKGD